MLCPLCGEVRVRSICQLMTHIRLFHSDQPGFCIQCNLQGCKRTFRKFTVYRNHVYAYHNTASVDEDNSYFNDEVMEIGMENKSLYTYSNK